MIGLTDTEFAWTMAGVGSAAVLLVLWAANRRRTDEPEWAPWDTAMHAKGLCPVHPDEPCACVKGGRDTLGGDHPDWTDPEPMTTDGVDAMYANVLDGTPLPERTLVRIVVSSPEVMAWLHEQADQVVFTVADIAIEIDTKLPGHLVRYVWSDGVVEQDVSESIRERRLRIAERIQLDRQADPNVEVEPNPRRTHLRHVAADVDRHLGIRVDHHPGHDDTIPTPEWDTKPAGFGRIVPDQRDGSES